MGVVDHFLSIFTLFGSFLFFMFAAGQLTVVGKTSRNHLIAALFITAGFVNGFAYLLESGVHTHLPPLVMLPPFALLFLTGPIAYLLFRDFVDEGIRAIEYYVHFLLPTLVLIGGIVYVGVVPERAQETVVDLLREPFGLLRGLFLGSLLSNALYSTRIVRETGFLWRSSDRIDRSISAIILVHLIIFPFIGVLFACLFAFTTNILFLEISTSTITLTQLLGYIAGNRYPETYQHLQTLIIENTPRRSILGKLDLDQIERRMNSMLAEEKVYRRENLSLRDLAEELEISAHQLSEFCNERLKKNFTSLVNEYRVEEAKERLVSSQTHSIISIGYEAGFGSPAAFYRAFQKFVGVSPKRFREKAR